MTQSDHLTWSELLAALEGAVEGSGRRTHLEACQECRARLERLAGWIEILPEAVEPGAPDLWIRRAQQRAVPRGFLSPMRGAYAAQVVFDSALDRRAGIRSAGEGERQWLLASERLELEVALSDPDEPSPYGLSGQLFSVGGEPPPLEGCRVRLVVEGQTADESRSRASGEFMIRQRPAGPFRIVVEGDGWEVSTSTLTP